MRIKKSLNFKENHFYIPFNNGYKIVSSEKGDWSDIVVTNEWQDFFHELEFEKHYNVKFAEIKSAIDGEKIENKKVSDILLRAFTKEVGPRAVMSFVPDFATDRSTISKDPEYDDFRELGFNQRQANIVFDFFGSLEEASKKTKEELVAIKGIGDTLAEKILSYKKNGNTPTPTGTDIREVS